MVVTAAVVYYAVKCKTIHFFLVEEKLKDLKFYYNFRKKYVNTANTLNEITFLIWIKDFLFSIEKFLLLRTRFQLIILDSHLSISIIICTCTLTSRDRHIDCRKCILPFDAEKIDSFFLKQVMIQSTKPKLLYEYF